MSNPKASVAKLRKLKQIRRKNLEKNFLEIQMKGMDHYVFIKDNGKAQVVYEEGRWVAEHIRTAILKYNYEIDDIKKYCTHLVRHKLEQDVFLASMLNRLIELEAAAVVKEIREKKKTNPVKKFFHIP